MRFWHSHRPVDCVHSDAFPKNPNTHNQHLTTLSKAFWIVCTIVCFGGGTHNHTHDRKTAFCHPYAGVLLFVNIAPARRPPLVGMDISKGGLSPESGRFCSFSSPRRPAADRRLPDGAFCPGSREKARFALAHRRAEANDGPAAMRGSRPGTPPADGSPRRPAAGLRQARMSTTRLGL